MTSLEKLERALFALVAAAFCILLSFRPIPDIGSKNDTGRYIDHLHQYCSGAIEERFIAKDVSYRIFFTVMSPACWVESDGLFLFEAALFLPLGFLLFARWRKGSFLWSTSLLLSVFGLELMTNALRQSLGMLLFFGAVTFGRANRTKALLLGLLAVAAHTSVLAFYPLLFWMVSARSAKKWLIASGGIVLLAGIGCVIVLKIPVFEFIKSVDKLRATYSIMYEEELKRSFILFMVLPLFFVYGLRFLFNRESVDSDERKAIIYSSALLLLIYIFFPYITYRFAIFSFAIQIFLITRSERPSLAAGGYALCGLMMHLSFMLTLSSHFEELIYG